jgi:hypothetical protein
VAILADLIATRNGVMLERAAVRESRLTA